MTSCLSEREWSVDPVPDMGPSSFVEAGIPYDPRGVGDAGTADALPQADVLFPPDLSEEGDTGPIVRDAVRTCGASLEYRATGTPASVSAAGDFNGWSPTAAPLFDPDGDGTWSATLPLEEGEWAYRFVVDGVREGEPPPGDYTIWSSGEEHRALRVGNCNLPLLGLVEAEASAEGRIRATLQFTAAADAAPIDPASVHVFLGETQFEAEIDVAAGRISVDASGLPDGKHSLRVRASDEAGRPAENEPLFVPLWVEPTPFRWDDALMYFAFVDRFRDSDGQTPGGSVSGVDEIANWAGGDLRGLLDALRDGWFDELGVNLLWLSPLLDNPDGRFVGNGANEGRWFSGYHGYWPVAPRAIEPRLGTADEPAEDLLDEVIAEAHARGVRVLFDLVLNHVHEGHEYVSAHPDWFADACGVCGAPGCGWEERPVDCLFSPYLPDLNYRNPEVLRAVSEDVLWLAQRFDVDAFRIDAAKHMDHAIMRRLSLSLRDRFEEGGGAPFWLVGETFTGADGRALIMDYVAPWELDGQFDFPLLWPLRDALVHGAGLDALDRAVASGEREYAGALNSPFLGNHDIPRLATEIATGGSGIDAWSGVSDPMDGEAATTQSEIVRRMAFGFAFLLTQRGVPLIYYGDEIGLAGGADPDNRRPMPWGADLSPSRLPLLASVRELGQARRRIEALRRGVRRTLLIESDAWVYGLAVAPGDVAIVALNRGASRTLELAVPPEWELEGVRLAVEAGSGESVLVSGGVVRIPLGTWEYAVLAPE